MKSQTFTIPDSLIHDGNKRLLEAHRRDLDSLAEKLQRRGIDIEKTITLVQEFSVAVPSWGVGTGGTRFARFPGQGEPRNAFEKLEDCGTIQQLMRCTPAVSLHIPWDKPDDAAVFREFAADRGLRFDAMNSNTFQDQPGQAVSYKFGSLSHTDRSVRQAAVAHNRECIEIGKTLGSKALTIWIADGGNFPGQVDFQKSLERYLESTHEIYKALPADWKMFVEYKLYEPAFYSTVINDWGTAYYVTTQLGKQAFCLVDLGHHAPNVNIEMIVARLIQLKKLGGFHFNDSKYGDDDLDAGSIRPYQLFLIFRELIGINPNDAAIRPSYMIDQSHNVTDPIESLMSSAEELQRAYAQALLVDRNALEWYQTANDGLMASRVLKQAFGTDVQPIIREARVRSGGAIDPIGVFRTSGYRGKKGEERPESGQSQAGIV